MSKTTNKFSPELRQRAVRLVFDQEHEHPSRWATIMSIAAEMRRVLRALRALIAEANVLKRDWSSGPRLTVPVRGRDLECDFRIISVALPQCF